MRRIATSRRLGQVAVVLVWILGGSLTVLRLGASRGADFQWSGARMLGQGLDPYLTYLHGDGSEFAFFQFPNYLPLLYVLLLPFGLLALHTATLIWGLANIAMALGAAALLGRAARLTGWQVAGLLGVVQLSEPFSSALGQGQQTVLVLFCAVLAARSSRAAPAGFALAVLLTKYSFAPLAIMHLAARRWRVLAVAAGVELGALVMFCLITGSSIGSTLFNPLRVASGMARGASDVMSLTVALGASTAVQFGAAFVVVCALSRLGWRVLTRDDWVESLAVCAIIALLSFPHLQYDALLLLPALTVGLRRTGWSRVAILAPIGVLWFGWFLGGLVIDPYHVVGILQTMLLLGSVFAGIAVGRQVPARTQPRVPHAQGPRIPA